MRIKHTQSFAGFSLLEMLIYVALLSAFSLMVIFVLLSVASSYRALRAQVHLNTDVATIIDRLGHQIRLADGVDGASVLNVSPGNLKLLYSKSQNNEGQSGAAVTSAEFYLSGGALHLKQNDTDTGALTGSNTTLSNLIFRKVGSGTAAGVRTEFTLTSVDGTASSTQNFYTFFVLRSAS